MANSLVEFRRGRPLMWVLLNNAFLSIVADQGDPYRLLVRARFPGDISAVFPDADVLEPPAADCRFRAFLPRERVAAKLAELASKINYDNFKGPVWDSWRHDICLKIWRILLDAQKIPLFKEQSSVLFRFIWFCFI